MPPAAANFDFLALPAELRNEIYRLCVVNSTDRDQLGFPRRCSLRQPAIMRACRTTRQKTLAMFYRHNLFTLALRLHDPALEPPGEEHRWLRLLRAVKALAESPHFPHIQELEIVACLDPHDLDPKRERLEYGIRLLRDRPETKARSLLLPGWQCIWLLAIGCGWHCEPRYDTQELKLKNWADFDLVHQAVEPRLLDWGTELASESIARRADTLRNAHIGRLVAVLSLLLGPSGTGKHVFG